MSFLHFPARGGWQVLDEACRPADFPCLAYLGQLLSAFGCASRHRGMLLPGAAANRHTILAHLTVQSKPPSNHDVRNTGTGASFDRFRRQE